MISIEIDKTINQIENCFYQLGLWHRGDQATARETAIKLFFSIYTVLLPISLLSGVSLSSESREDDIFLIEAAIMTVVMSVKIFYIIWRKGEILQTLEQVAKYSIKNAKESKRVKGILNRFMAAMKVFLLCSVSIAVCALLIVPFLGTGTDRKLFFNIGFPLDWKQNALAYWIAFTFILTEVMMSAISLLFSVIMWYLLLNCSLRFEILGDDLRNMGAIDELDASGKKRKISKMEKENQFSKDLDAAIQTHQDIIDSTTHLEYFLSHMHAAQIGFSALCICGSIYCLANNEREIMVEFIIYLLILIYNILDIFIVTYFGNEITLSSDRLSYCIFESKWFEQQSCLKSILIFCERLKQPLVLVVLKLYPLTLDLFTRILNNAYSMYNILKTLSN